MQLRQHLTITLRHRIRWWRTNRRILSLGGQVYIEKNVEFLRYPRKISIGMEVVLKEGVRICACNKNTEVEIGDRTTVGYHTFIFASERIKIGNDCLIAPFVYLVDSNHGIKREKLINKQPNETAPIIIGNGVWIGSNVTILKGVTIGKGAVIAANSVVNRDVSPFEIWGGTPARKIDERK